jgi:hypothetical protein
MVSKNPIPTRPVPPRNIQITPTSKHALSYVTTPSFVLGCGILWFVVSIALAIGLGVPLALALAKNKNTIDVDLSGVGTCNGTQIYVHWASQWTQYPATPNTTMVYAVDPSFQGKNAIVWNANGDVQDFVITNVNDMTVTTDRTLITQGKCHFTLDAASECQTMSEVDASNNPNAYFQMEKCRYGGR